ncbi:MAG TPA: PepSY-associated TM helix domain-containing protein [Bryobacteraceae bacterium]|nr:PepSY-associated TM helix domain-containing protein [Bryobacteraceae bacterium]
MNIAQTFVRRPRRLAIRRLNFVIHLWAGILLAVYLVVIGATGSILVLRSEIESLCGLKQWQNIHANPPYADIATVVANLQEKYPRSHIVSVMTPSAGQSTFVAVLQSRRQFRVACDPRTGAILGEFSRKPNWLDFVRELHETLLIRRNGRVLNGVGAAFLLLLNATGLVIWWPGIRTWRRALVVDLKRGWRRINFDLHSAAGFWTLAIVSFWAVTGIYFAWPRQTFLFVNSFSPVISARPPAIIVPLDDTTQAPQALDLHRIIDHARQVDPDTTLGGVLFPYGRRAPLGVLMHRRESPGREYDDTVYFNPHTGDYISTWRYGVNVTLGDWFIWLQVPLHFGTYWGLGVKLIWAAAGLAIPLLTITGLLMYWNRVLRKTWRRMGSQTPFRAPRPLSSGPAGTREKAVHQ